MQAPVESGLLYKSASDPVYGPLGLAQWVSILRVMLCIIRSLHINALDSLTGAPLVHKLKSSPSGHLPCPRAVC